MIRLLRRGVLAAALLLLAAAAPASADPVAVGHSGWHWGNPQPQGNTLRGLAFAGARGFAVGDFGTLLTTGDAGASWAGLSTGTFANLDLVQSIDADSVVIGGGCTVRRSDDGGRTFRRLPFTSSERRCSTTIRAFSFSSADSGFLLLADGTVLRTTDGGASFQKRVSVPGTPATGSGAEAATDIDFVTPTVGVATTGAGADGHVYRTTDGGGSWVLVASSDGADTTAGGGPLQAVRFVTAAVGYAVGDAGALLRTGDGGATWSERAVRVAGRYPGLRDVACASADVCLFTTDTGGSLIRTVNGGADVTAVTPASSPVFAAGFAPGGRAAAVGFGGTSVVSSDAGATFSAVGAKLAGAFSALRAGPRGTAFALGAEGLLGRTTDGGFSWTSVGVSTPDDLRDVAFPTAAGGYVLDTAGALLRTDNAGSSWSLLDTGSDSAPRGVVAPTANTVLLVGPRGVLRSTDGGDSFTAVGARAVAHKALFDYDRAGRNIVVYGRSSAAVTANDGRTWSALKLPKRAKGDTFSRVDLTDRRHGWVLTSLGRAYRTRNGTSWSRVVVPTLGGFAPADLAFATSKSGWASVPTNPFGVPLLLRTDDGGATWNPQVLGDEGIGRGRLLATSAKGGYALAGLSGLFSTASGGKAGTTSSLSLATRKKTLTKAATITVTVRLTPPEGREVVVVAMRNPKSGGWARKTVQVATNGRVSTRWRVTGTRTFYAQWTGDDERAGDGAKPLTVKVVKRKRRK